MKRHLILLLCSALFLSCASKKFEKNRGVSLHQNSEHPTEINQKIVTRPTEVVLTGHNNYRLITTYKVNFNAKGDYGYTGENRHHYNYNSQLEDSLNVWHHHFLPGLNTIFGYNLFNASILNIAQSNSQPFFESNVLINTIYYPSHQEDTLKGQPLCRNYYLVSVYDEDTNNDSIFNTKDLRRFYKYDLEGQNPVLLVPKNYSVLSCDYDYVNDLMFVYARLDENKNGKRELDEPIHLFQIALKEPEMGKLIYKE